MKKRFTEEQIIGFLREAEAGVAVKDLCRRHGFSEASYYLWRSKHCRSRSDSSNTGSICMQLRSVGFIAENAVVMVKGIARFPSPPRHGATSSQRSTSGRWLATKG